MPSAIDARPAVASGHARAAGPRLRPLAPRFAAIVPAGPEALSGRRGEGVLGLVTFIVFGLGFGLPLVVLSLLAGARQRSVVRFVTSHHRAIEIGSGLLLIAVAIWDLRENWDGILFTLGL